MNIQFQNQVNFKARLPFRTALEQERILSELQSKGISSRVVDSFVLTGRDLTNHVNVKKAELKAVKNFFDFETKLKQDIADYRSNRKKS